MIEVTETTMQTGHVVVVVPHDEETWQKTVVERAVVEPTVRCQILPFYDGKRIKRVIAWPFYKMRGAD